MQKHEFVGNPWVETCGVCDKPENDPIHIVTLKEAGILQEHIRSICAVTGIKAISCPICVPFKLREMQSTINHLKEMVEVLEKEKEWINVEDRLPEVGRKLKEYLVCGKGLSLVMILDWVDGEWYDPCDGDKILGIDYWNPLPEPPPSDNGLDEAKGVIR